MMGRVIVAGVGMSRFTRPSEAARYEEDARTAIADAIRLAGVEAARIGIAFAGYVYGDSTAGQRAAYAAGITGLPIVNVNNNCATGSTALYLAAEAVGSGRHDCALAFGFEQMRPGALRSQYSDRADPLELHLERAADLQPQDDSPFAARLFGGAGREHIARWGTSPATFAQLAVKARLHGSRNPNAVFREPLTLEAVLSSPMVYDPITRLQCCPPTNGAAAAVVVSEGFALRHGTMMMAAIRGQALVTDTMTTFEGSMGDLVGADMSRRAAAAVYEQASISPRDIDVVELHDCFTANELISYSALGLIDEGNEQAFVSDGRNSYGGDVVVNPSGGLLAKGHPLGATGLAQCAELSWHLAGLAGERQVDGARLALQHNVGLGGACVVTAYERV